MPFKNIKNLDHLLRLSSAYIGYRTEALYGEKHRDLKKVVEHEFLELNNPDIPETLIQSGKIKDIRETFRHIDEMYDNGYTECIWLCQSIEDLKNEYDEDAQLKYTIEDPIIISDLGAEGQLIAYKPDSINIEEVDGL